MFFERFCAGEQILRLLFQNCFGLVLFLSHEKNALPKDVKWEQSMWVGNEEPAFSNNYGKEE